MKSFLSFWIVVSLGWGLGYGQRNNTWCIGDSVLVTFLGGVNIDPAIKTRRFYNSNASISDNQGNLLLYANGDNGVNKYHQDIPGMVFTNGPDVSTQGVIILPKDWTESEYYIFSLTPYQVRYYTIFLDSNFAQGGGLLNAVAPLTLKMTATKHSNGEDWWLLLHAADNNKFVRYLISASGVSGPFYQNIGSSHEALGNNLIEDIFFTVKSAFVDAFEANEFLLDSSTIVDLTSIAVQCPNQGGFPVWESRALLALVGNMIWEEDSCADFSSKRNSGEKAKEINNNHDPLILEVWPVPTSHDITVRISTKLISDWQVLLFDMKGVLVAKKKYKSGVSEAALELSSLPSGVYTLKYLDARGRSDFIKVVLTQ